MLPSNTTMRLENAEARRLFLTRQGLGRRPPATSPKRDLATLIHQLGFVQIDSINTVARAHHMILSARLARYRPAHLTGLLERDRSLFEHWTHDAAAIPTEFYPYWRLRFADDRTRLLARWQSWHGQGFEERFDTVLDRIRKTGPVKAREVGEDEGRRSGGWWEWHPSKTALEFLWRTGALAVCRREGFQKVFDLAENVVPAALHGKDLGDEAIIDWACNAALDRLGFGTSGEIAAFWDLISPVQAKEWCRTRLVDGTLIEAVIALADGSPRRVFARPDLAERAAQTSPLTGRIRVLSPFDPALRDRRRAERLFGFHYRIEVFVPAPRRRYGYYVFPLLEGERLIGRIDMRREGIGPLTVRALWPEPGLRFGKGRMERLEAELHRVARFAGCGGLTFLDGWLREPMGEFAARTDAPKEN